MSMARATHLIERTEPSELLIRTEPSMLRSGFENLFAPRTRRSRSASVEYYPVGS
jgi:hypothetical protein